MLAFYLVACSNKTQEEAESIDKSFDSEKRLNFISKAKPQTSIQIDSIIKNLPDSLAIEFIDLYKDTREIPDNDTSILVSKLKAQQFNMTNYGKGNWTKGPRMIKYWLESNEFICRIDKLYHSDTTIKNVYRITERIACLRK